MKKILTFGTFDVLHPGHISYLTQAQNMGDELHILVALDTTVQNIKGKLPRQDHHTRKKVLEEYFVDAIAYLGDQDDHMHILDIVRPDIICLGYDQNSFVDELQKALDTKKLQTKIIRLKPFYEHMYKSSIFRSRPPKQKNMHGA